MFSSPLVIVILIIIQSTVEVCSSLLGEELEKLVFQHLLLMKPDLSKQSLVGGLDLLSLGVASSAYQL